MMLLRQGMFCLSLCHFYLSFYFILFFVAVSFCKTTCIHPFFLRGSFLWHLHLICCVLLYSNFHGVCNMKRYTITLPNILSYLSYWPDKMSQNYLGGPKWWYFPTWFNSGARDSKKFLGGPKLWDFLVMFNSGDSD